MRHILTMNREEKLKFLNSFDIILSDCDGVIWLVLDEIPKTGDAINLLKSVQKKYKFISNNSMRNDDDYIRKLNEIGVRNVEKNDIVHPLKTIIYHFNKTKMTKPILSLANKFFNNALRLAGYKIIEIGNEVFDNLKDFIDYLPITEKCGAVILDIDFNLSLAKLTKAQLYLQDPECEFIVGASDMLITVSNNLTIMGPGRFINILTDITSKKPTILGKPGKLLGNYLIENFNIMNTKRVLLIGDALIQDIQFGRNCGFLTLLVLSGATKKEAVDMLKIDEKPDYYADSMADFIDFFNDLLNFSMNVNRKMRHILSLNREEKLEFLNSFDTILNDCDGCIWHLLDPIPDSGAAINLLKGAEKSVKFISNNSMRSDDDYIRKLNEIGVIDVNCNDVVHPVKAVIRHFDKINLTKPVYTMAGDIFNSYLREAGYKIVENEYPLLNNLQEFANHLPVSEKCGAVIIDIDFNLTIAKLSKALLYLQDPNCEFVAGASDMMMHLTNNIVVMGPGGFIKMLRDYTGRKPTILGKPGELLGDYLIENFNITDTKRALLIGDSLIQDIHFGQNCGFQTLLVLSGITKKETACQLKDDKKPDYYADSMADFLDFFEDLL